MRAVSTGREGGGRPRGLSRPSGEMADQLLQGLLAGPAGAREELIFSLRFSVNQSEPDATAFYDSEWQVVDTRFGRAGCPAALSKKFPSLNQWAKAVKGRPVSVKVHGIPRACECIVSFPCHCPPVTQCPRLPLTC